ncbi:hypothetical protein Mapa_010436 [Marchantia paleacea]|nr:hypothetical protein Mapa_010436 [Marchantia paleacea]
MCSVDGCVQVRKTTVLSLRGLFLNTSPKELRACSPAAPAPAAFNLGARVSPKAPQNVAPSTSLANTILKDFSKGTSISALEKLSSFTSSLDPFDFHASREEIAAGSTYKPMAYTLTFRKAIFFSLTPTPASTSSLEAPEPFVLLENWMPVTGSTTSSPTPTVALVGIVDIDLEDEARAKATRECFCAFGKSQRNLERYGALRGCMLGRTGAVEQSLVVLAL